MANSHKTLHLGLLVFSLAVLGAACGAKKVANTNSTKNTIVISATAFTPSTLIVRKGTSVTWKNDDTAAHTVIGDKGGPASGSLKQGKTYSYTFQGLGLYPFHLDKDATIQGQINVVP